MAFLTKQFQVQVFDSILEVLFLHKDRLPVELKEIQGAIPLRLSDSIVYMYLNRLNKEGFVELKTDFRYQITLEGINLYKDGGYIKQLTKKRLKKLLKIITVVIGILGVILSALSTVIQIF